VHEHLFSFKDNTSWLVEVPIELHLRQFVIYTIISRADRREALSSPKKEDEKKEGEEAEADEDGKKPKADEPPEVPLKIYQAELDIVLTFAKTAPVEKYRSETLEKQTIRDVRRVEIDRMPVTHDIEEMKNTKPSAKNKLQDVRLLDFKLESVLGRGTFGKVFLATLEGKKEKYAIKCIRIDVMIEHGVLKETALEMEIMFQVDNPFLVHLDCVFRSDRRIFFVMPFVKSLELADIMAK